MFCASIAGAKQPPVLCYQSIVKNVHWRTKHAYVFSVTLLIFSRRTNACQENLLKKALINDLR